MADAMNEVFNKAEKERQKEIKRRRENENIIEMLDDAMDLDIHYNDGSKRNRELSKDMIEIGSDNRYIFVLLCVYVSVLHVCVLKFILFVCFFCWWVLLCIVKQTTHTK